MFYLFFIEALPGLAFEEQPIAAVVPLRDHRDGAIAISAGRSYSLRLVNETDRVIRPLLLDDSGTRLFWRRFHVMKQAEAEDWDLRVAFGAGEYEVRDRIGGTRLAWIVAS